MKAIIRITGLDCSACATKLEDIISAIDGVESVSISLHTAKVSLTYATDETYNRVVDAINNFDDVKVLAGDIPAKSSHFLSWLRIAASVALFACGAALKVWGMSAMKDFFAYILYGIAYIVVGYPVLISTAKNVAKGRFFDENFLMTVASIGAFCLQEYAEGVMVMLLYQIGETLQAVAVGASRKSVARLVELKAENATRLIPGGAETVAPEELIVGDRLLVKTGDKIPCDCTLLSTLATLDTKSLTGESALSAKKVGDELLAGSINAGDAFMAQVVRAYENSAVAKILDMVENCMDKKATPEKFISKFSRVYTPIVCMLAICIALFPPIVLGIANGSYAFVNGKEWIKSALTFLVISCPCALVISVPLTYFSGIGSCAKRGILVKNAAALETVSQVKIAALDKTGTLTKGDFSVIACYPAGIAEDELLSICRALEEYSSHPIANAFSCVELKTRATDVKECAGKGLKGYYEGKIAVFGTAAFLREEGYSVIERFSSDTVLYVAYDGKYCGCVEIGDKVREESKGLISDLKETGISSVMLTGDFPARAQKVANMIGVSTFKAGLLPNEKVGVTERLKEEGKVLYVGDGINDAPVMVVADCAVAMGALGSAAAVDAADVVLLQDTLSGVTTLIRLAKKTRNIVLQNIVFSIIAKVSFMVLGLFPWFPLWMAVFADVGVMLLAVLNSFRVRRIKND